MQMNFRILSAALCAAILAASNGAHADGNLRADPDRGRSRARQARPAWLLPNKLRFETGKLYKLVLKNVSDDPHYFPSHAFSQMIFTRKVQVTQVQAGKTVTLAEFKGTIREVEGYSGQSAEWWFVPIAAGRITDLMCGIVGKDGRTHAHHGMIGEIVID